LARLSQMPLMGRKVNVSECCRQFLLVRRQFESHFIIIVCAEESSLVVVAVGATSVIYWRQFGVVHLVAAN